MGRKDKKEESTDFITIVESVEKEIPEKRPPFEAVLYDHVPEIENTVTARADDHASTHGK